MLIKPIITEKSMRLAEKGQFTFGVSKETTKHEVKQLVETSFKVNVLKVRILKTASKTHRVGRKGFSSATAAKYKAIITLKPGQTIEYFEVPKEKKTKKL